MNIVNMTEYLFAIQNLRIEKKEKWADGTDFFALDVIADEKVLVRTVQPHNKSGFVGADDVKHMLEAMRRKNCERGIMVGKRFTNAAIEEMRVRDIQQASEEYMPPVAPENLVLTINSCINSLCRAKCGAVPAQESDCKSLSKNNPCFIRSISDDALFHYERGWIDLLKNDLKQLLAISKTTKD